MPPPKEDQPKMEARDAAPQDIKEDEITGKLKARSVSLTRSDARKSLSPKKTSPPSKKTSPGKCRKRKSKVSVRERTSRFEQVRDKYKTQRSMKEFNRGRDANKKEKRPKINTDEEEGSISDLLKTINANILSMKTDLKSNSEKIDSINDKIVDLEVNAGKNEKENKKRFDAINANVARIETNVTDKVVNIIDPQIKSLKAELKSDMSSELKSLVQEEFNRRFPKENEESPALVVELEEEVGEGVEPEKNKKSKKKYKIHKTQKK